jgi:hypothetical protein
LAAVHKKPAFTDVQVGTISANSVNQVWSVRR